MALFQGRARIARRMLKDVNDINLKTGHFGNALQAAAFGGHPMMVTMVLDRGATVDSRGRYGTALRAAALRGHDTVVRLLIDNGASVGMEDRNAMQGAALNGHLSTVRLLMDSGLYSYDFCSHNRGHAIEVACFKGYIDIAKIFLERGDPRAAFIAFDGALQGGHETIMRLALEYEPSLKDSELPDGSENRCSAGGSLSLFPTPRRHVCHKCCPRRHDGEPGQAHDENGNREGHDNASLKFEGRLPWFELDGSMQRQGSLPDKTLSKNNNINGGNGKFLRLAARHGYMDIIERLLGQGFNMDTTGNYAGPNSGQSTPIEVAAASGQTRVVKLFLNKGARVGKALSHAVRNQSVAVIRLLLQELPEISIDEPAYRDWTIRSNSYYGYPKSAISVAIVWDLPHILGILVHHAKQRGYPAIGQGLVTAVREQKLDLLRLILRGFRLRNHWDDDHTAREHYNALFQAAKQAAHHRDIDVIRLLLEHTLAESTKRRLLSIFLRDGIIKADWYTALEDITAAFAPIVYDYLPQVALTAVAAKQDDPWWSRKFDKRKPRVFGVFRRLFESYHMCDSTYAKAFTEAAKSNNVEIVCLLLRGRHIDYTSPDQIRKVPWLNQEDEHGNTALYYACARGYADMFHTLVKAGADVYTYHFPYSCDDDSETSSETSSETGQRVGVRPHTKVSLLQIALDSRLKSEWSGTAKCAWKEPLQKTWGPIVCCLLDAGLEIDLESPSLIKFFYISCFQGELDYVKKLLAKHVRLIGQAGSGNGHRYSFGTALHSATVGGQKSVAKLLLEHGADVRVKGDNRYHGKAKNQSAVQTALENGIYDEHSREYSSVLKTCAYLVDSGASESDAKIVLRNACGEGDVEVMKQMLQRVAKIQGLTPTDDVELYHLLVHSESYIDSHPDFISNLQLGAIRQGDIPFLANIVDRYGPQEGPDKAGDIATAFIECKGDRASILRYLVQNFSFNINTMHPMQRRSTKMVNPLLRATCISRNPEAVEFLLQEGVNPDSPDLRQTPLMSTLKVAAHIGRIQSIIRIVKSLLQYGADVNGSRKIDREADDSLKPQFQRTPLIYAIWRNRHCVDTLEVLEVVKLLVDHNADINHGEVTPLQLARYFGIPETENLLLQHGAKDHGDPAPSVVADYVNKLTEDRDIY